jgi:DEAD/DEAH box helicase domain-containing protein
MSYCALVYSYILIAYRQKKILDVVNVDTPPWERETTGLWIDVSKDVLEMMRFKGINIAEGIHAAEHAFLNQFVLSADVKTECKPAEKEYAIKQTTRKRPAR